MALADKYIQPKMKKLFLIFLVAIVLRFLYFPNNIYFGFDQARDAFASLSVARGDIRLVGPPTSTPGLFHGPLYYYLFAPVYKISQGSPLGISAVLRVFNALGIFLVFYIAYLMFGKKSAYIASFLYAISFEQTQFAIYINHPSLGVISVLLFYLGLAMLIFQRKPKGWFVLALGLGLSLQFEFVLIVLLPILMAFLLIFFKKISKPSLFQAIICSGMVLFFVSSFLLAEIKFHSNSLPLIFSVANSTSSVSLLDNFSLILNRFFQDNILNLSSPVYLVFYFFLFTWLWYEKKTVQAIFVILWMLGGILPYIHNSNTLPLYYHVMGASVGLLILVSYFLSKKPFLLIIVLISNLYLITSFNSFGSLPSFNVQSGMLLTHEIQVINYIYNQAKGKEFSINALTMPLYINTTWSYLFSWYAKGRNLPIWGGEQALGYLGENTFKIETARSKLPDLQFLILEPTRGIAPNLVSDFVRLESYFTKVISQQSFGQFVVQTRAKIVQ